MSLTSIQQRHALASLLALAAAGTLGACNTIFGVDDLQFEPSTTGGGGPGGTGSSAGGTGGASSSASSSATGGGFGGGGAGGNGGAGGMGGAGGSGGVAPVGCSDGSRELFTSPALHPNIAGCSGAWSVQGLTSAASQQPQCGRQAGNDGAIVNGNGCSVADLCNEGWHVCVDKDDVSMHSTIGCTPFSIPAGIWIVRTGSPTNSNECNTPGPNNLFGCGTSFDAAPASCSPLTRIVAYAPCSASSIWECGPSFYSTMEATRVTKSSPDDGGVLCCKDP